MNYVNPYKYLSCIFADGEPGSWTTKYDLGIDLETHVFDDLSYKDIDVENGILYVPKATNWNGSNLVVDTCQCALASLVHDCLCWLLNHNGLGGFAGFWKRRLADKIYRRICKAQGMWGIRASVRFTGLRLAAPWHALLKQIKRKE